MGFSKEEKFHRILRVVKTFFFLITMVMSLLLLSAPVLLVIADAFLPSVLLSALSTSSLSFQSFHSLFNNYNFRYSLIDIPLVSIIRSLIIFCVYSFCDGPRLSRGPYLGITTLCSVLSLIFVLLKAVLVFSNVGVDGRGYVRVSEIALFVCSCALAVGHIVVAYRTSCRERRKLLIYKIDHNYMVHSFTAYRIQSNAYHVSSRYKGNFVIIS
ncbi:hypothetical protein Lalb_Chr10g0105131 [Lupinus albus]|uniref:MENTAL domain-containing protein n=1 Tax=Lupinus albus TaxID=3870 RepID=A0A6A4PWR2_LUPAL|nr:hypothetical protein Lalb_Chr10g0105131 [Lupinus albus]